LRPSSSFLFFFVLTTPVSLLPQAEQTFDHMLAKLKLDPKDPQREMVHLFLTMMAVCHTVIPEVDPKKPGGLWPLPLMFSSEINPSYLLIWVEIKYQASSPDEAAIVKGAKELDYEFIVRPLFLSPSSPTHKPLTKQTLFL